ncbi:MAG: V-type ATPase subunit [Eubacterium sp.]|nr:V-type ATPase subunit [Eubacterium sp.]
MPGLISYSALAAKIRAMDAKLLTESDFRELLSCPDVPSFASLLRQKPSYAPIFGDLNPNSLHRGDIEPLLRQSIFLDYTKLYRFADAKQREFLRLYFIRYEVHLLKMCLTKLFDQHGTGSDVSFFSEYYQKYSRLPAKELAEAPDLKTFLKALERTGYDQALAPLSAKPDASLFDYQFALDQYGFVSMWKKHSALSSPVERRQLTRILGSKFDMLNIIWIYRAKTYYKMSRSDIYALVLPIYSHISKDDIRALVECDTKDDLERLISHSWYARHFRGFSIQKMEADYTRIQKLLLKKESRQSPYSAVIMYQYLYRKEHEVDRLIIAMECVRYQVPSTEAEEYLANR